MHTRQGVAVPAQSQSNNSPSEYLDEVRALQSAQRADKIPPARASVADAYRDFLQPGGTYPPKSTADGKLTHSAECKGKFGRRDWRCPRCLELLRGAKPRAADYSATADSRQLRLL